MGLFDDLEDPVQAINQTIEDATKEYAQVIAGETQPMPDAGDDVLNKYANGGGGATFAKLAELKAETYVEPYSHVTIEITEDYASSSVVDWFHAYDSQGRAITMDMYNPKDTSVDLDDVEVGYLDYSIMGVSGVTDIRYGEEGDE